jgi:hypothetical protein
MTPGKYDITLRPGADFGPMVFSLQDAEGEPLNLTGHSVAAHVRAAPNGALVLDLAPDVTAPAEGEVTIYVPAADLEDVPLAKYGWDLVLTDGAGGKRVILAGAVAVRGTYTHE